MTKVIKTTTEKRYKFEYVNTKNIDKDVEKLISDISKNILERREKISNIEIYMEIEETEAYVG